MPPQVKALLDKGNLQYAMGLITKLLELSECESYFELSINKNNSTLDIRESTAQSKDDEKIHKFTNALHKLNNNECFEMDELNHGTQGFQLSGINKKSLEEYLGLKGGIDNVDEATWISLFEDTNSYKP